MSTIKYRVAPLWICLWLLSCDSSSPATMQDLGAHDAGFDDLASQPDMATRPDMASQPDDLSKPNPNPKKWTLKPSGVTVPLNGVWGSSPNDVYAVGAGSPGGLILHSVD